MTGALCLNMLQLTNGVIVTPGSIGSSSVPVRTIGSPPNIVGSFEYQVALGPDRIAISHAMGHVTYGELDDRSNRMARWIASRAKTFLNGIHQPLIPIALSQGPDRIVALLAILKLGGAYVPIEPNYPAARIRRLLDDIDADFVITEASQSVNVLAAVHDEKRPIDVFFVDTERNSIASQSAKPISAREGLGPESPCYVMFTSGSTGTPKGVLIPHRGVVRLCVDTNYMEVRPGHCFAQLANIAFDAATWEIWGALLNGARLALLDGDTALSTPALGQAIRAHAITHIFLTTALWNQHIATDPTIFAPLDYLLFGGEAVSVAMVRHYFTVDARPKHLLHVYGPTENTTYSTAYEITSAPREDSVPIGKSISGTSCHVVQERDGRLVLAPPGARGELLVGGLGLALGYHRDLETTRVKFVECAFCPDERLYRTGDLVDVLPSGNLVFVGRTDNQVKLRGFRIEPEEIEIALAAHPRVNAAAVLMQTSPQENKHLVAYFVENAAYSRPLADVSELRQFLKERIPEFMIPSFFVRVAAFPLGVTGKVDRARLAQISGEILRSGRAQIAPRTATEQAIHGRWIATSGIVEKDSSIHSDFFELGGDSLWAARFAAELRQDFAVDVGVHDIFRERTTARLAVFVEAHISRGIPMAQIDIPRVEADGFSPLSFAQEQIWLHQQLAPDAIFYNEPLDITIPEALNVAAFEKALNLFVARHEVLRATIDIADGMPRQRFAPHEHRPLPLVDLRHLPRDLADAEAQERAEDQARRPFDLAKGPLFRAILVRLADEVFRLFVVGHHLIFDGVTMFRIFSSELDIAYRAFVRGVEPSLPAIETRFRDFVHYERFVLHEKRQQRWSQ
ncbi:MAG TPA: amino acid adenylation domain-containing protein, partial [Polyangium sp.]|nr:amino acid adenylation domain-containing protein [Polyangium sp.]